MTDLALALDQIVPNALYRGSLTANTQDAYEAILWDDARPQPTYDEVVAADAEATIKSLKLFAANTRWTRQSGGFTYHAILYSTDLNSPTAIGNAYSRAQADPNYSTKWKTYDGSFVSLIAQDIIGLFQSIQAFTDALFAAEAQCSSGIDAGTITTENQITAIINSVPNSL